MAGGSMLAGWSRSDDHAVDPHRIPPMRFLRQLLVRTIVGGVLVLLPIYLSILVVLKALELVGGLVTPISKWLPDWIPVPELITVAGLFGLCFLVGAVVATPPGRAIRERLESWIFARLPGYALFRGLSHRLAGQSARNEWKPALAEIEEALVPAFIVEEFPDGRFTVFVPSVPTPLAGAVYILPPERVHPVDVPFTQAVAAVSRWGSGCRELVEAMEAERREALRTSGRPA